MLILSVPYLLGSRDVAAAGRTTSSRRWTGSRCCSSFWISPREHPDFAWAWLTRLLVNLGNWIALNYLYYFLTDGLGYNDDDATAKLGLLVLIYGAHDRRHHRCRGPLERPHRPAQDLRDLVRHHHRDQLPRARPLAGMARRAARRGDPRRRASASTRPSTSRSSPRCSRPPTERAKDLGVINIASALPQVMAPAIAGLILVVVTGSWAAPSRRTVTGGRVGYGVVYAVGFVLCVLGSVFVTRIKSVA